MISKYCPLPLDRETVALPLDREIKVPLDRETVASEVILVLESVLDASSHYISKARDRLLEGQRERTLDPTMCLDRSSITVHNKNSSASTKGNKQSQSRGLYTSNTPRNHLFLSEERSARFSEGPHKSLFDQGRAKALLDSFTSKSLLSPSSSSLSSSSSVDRVNFLSLTQEDWAKYLYRVRVLELGDPALMNLQGASFPMFRNIDRFKNRLGIREEQEEENTTFDTVMLNFRDFFCRRCYTYDCEKHGHSQARVRVRVDPPIRLTVPETMDKYLQRILGVGLKSFTTHQGSSSVGRTGENGGSITNRSTRSNSGSNIGIADSPSLGFHSTDSINGIPRDTLSRDEEGTLTAQNGHSNRTSTTHALDGHITIPFIDMWQVSADGNIMRKKCPAGSKPMADANMNRTALDSSVVQSLITDQKCRGIKLLNGKTRSESVSSVNYDTSDSNSYNDSESDSDSAINNPIHRGKRVGEKEEIGETRYKAFA